MDIHFSFFSAVYLICFSVCRLNSTKFSHDLQYDLVRRGAAVGGGVMADGNWSMVTRELQNFKFIYFSLSDSKKVNFEDC